MENILVSACLLGFNCKYSGGNNAMRPELIRALREKYHVIPVCPEYAGGLPTPRDPSERVEDKVMSCRGKDVTAEYMRGAEIALALAEKFGCRAAVLKEKSPSCGSGTVYDGTFSGKLVSGYGVAAQLLTDNGITVCGESAAEKLL